MLHWPAKWYLYKAPIVAFFGISRDALHIHFGLAAFIVIAFVCRKARRPLVIAWLAVLVLELTNETLDYLDWHKFEPDMPSDVINTMLWPTVIFVLSCRLRPLFGDYDHPGR